LSRKLGITIGWSEVAPPEGDELAGWVFWNMAPGMGSRRFLYMLQQERSTVGFARRLQSGVDKPHWLPTPLWTWVRKQGDPVEAGRRELDRARARRAEVVTIGSRYYPARLREIADAPPLLYMAGRRPPAAPVWVSVVGSRQASEYGVSVARRFCAELGARGVSIVSGLARGIDAAAHRGAMSVGGYTAGVLGCGIGASMTARLERMVGEVLSCGCVISPFPIGFPASTGTFPARNRVISGMSTACIVVEAAEVSGALITANFAVAQNRNVYVVPGDITRPTSRGVVNLLSDGASPVVSVDSVIKDLIASGHVLKPAPPKPTAADGGRSRGLTDNDVMVYASVGDLTSFESIQKSVAMPARQVMACLSRLELLGMVIRLDGLRFSRV
jgi:DNA processing protein